MEGGKEPGLAGGPRSTSEEEGGLRGIIPSCQQDRRTKEGPTPLTYAPANISLRDRQIIYFFSEML